MVIAIVLVFRFYQGLEGLKASGIFMVDVQIFMGDMPFDIRDLNAHSW